MGVGVATLRFISPRQHPLILGVSPTNPLQRRRLRKFLLLLHNLALKLVFIVILIQFPSRALSPPTGNTPSPLNQVIIKSTCSGALKLILFG